MAYFAEARKNEHMLLSSKYIVRAVSKIIRAYGFY